MARCARCKEKYEKADLFCWEEAAKISPSYCATCYDFILSRYEDGMDMEALLKDIE